MAFKSSYSRLARIFKKSRDRWREKAIKRREENRLLELKIRDLEISRQKWKKKALDGAGAKTARKENTEGGSEPLNDTELGDKNRDGEDIVNEETKEEDAKTTSADSSDLSSPANHHYPVSSMQAAIRAQVEGLASLRGTEKIFELFSPFLPEPMQKAPDHSTVQIWTQRLGLFLLNQPIARRNDWIFIMDHFLERGVTKCLVILGISCSELPESGYSPSHKSMTLLELEVVKNSTGEKIQASLEKLSRRIGEPVQIVSDHGSDLQKGISLFREEHPKTTHTYDISHRLAILLKAEVETDPFWEYLQEKCNRLRAQLQQTEWDFLMPPAKRTKGRFMAMHRIEWVLNLLSYWERGDFSGLQPVYSLNWECCDYIGDRFGSDAMRAVSCLNSVDRFTSLDEFRGKITELIGTEIPLESGFFELADERRRRFKEFFGGLLSDHRKFLPYAELVALIKNTQVLLKKDGLHSDSSKDLEKRLHLLEIAEGRAENFRDKILSTVAEETKKIPPDRILLASSDICESVIGKEKLFSQKSPLQEIGKSILMIPVFLSEITADLVRAGMQTVRNCDLKEWAKNTFGDSAVTKRRRAFKDGFDDTKSGGTLSAAKS
jgi:hypothetical protein